MSCIAEIQRIPIEWIVNIIRGPWIEDNFAGNGVMMLDGPIRSYPFRPSLSRLDDLGFSWVGGRPFETGGRFHMEISKSLSKPIQL